MTVLGRPQGLSKRGLQPVAAGVGGPEDWCDVLWGSPSHPIMGSTYISHTHAQPVTFHSLESVEREFEGELALANTRERGDSLRVRGYANRTSVGGETHTESSLRSNEVIGLADEDYENASYFRGSTSHTIVWERFRKRRRRGYRGLELQANGTVQVTGSRLREYSEHNLTGLSTENRWTFAWLGEGIVKTEVDYGFGRPTPITPLIRALEVERALVETGIVSGELDDTTLVAVAHWLATEFVHGVEHDLPDKFFYSALDDLLGGMESFDPNQITAGTVMRIREAVDWSYPFLGHGVRLSVHADLEVAVIYDNSRAEPDTSGDRQSSGFMFDQSNEVSLVNASLQWAVTPRLFLGVSARMLYAGSGDDFTMDNQLKGLWPTYGASAHLLLTNRLLLSARMVDLPTEYFVVPDDWPRLLTVDFSFFLENHVWVTLELSREHGCNPYDSVYGPDHTVEEHTARASLGVTYGF